MNLLSAFGGGLWIIILLIASGAAYFFVRAYKASQSGSSVYNPQLKRTLYSDKNVPIYKTGYFILGCIAVVALIGAIAIMISER